MKTAVEWFEQQLDNLDIEIPFSIYAEAKEIEKEQIINAYADGRISVIDREIISYEQYYNKKFNKDENK